MLSVSRTKDVGNDLDPDCAPRSKENNSLFQERQKFVYFLFERTLLAENCKSCAHKLESTRDTQRFCAMLLLKMCKC